MPDSITCSSKILTLAIAPFLFILVGVLFEFAMVSGVYILLSLRKKRSVLLSVDTHVHIQQHIHQKDLNLCLALHYYAKVVVELKKTQTRNSTALCLRCL